MTPGPHPAAYTGPTPIAQAVHRPPPTPQGFPTPHPVAPTPHGLPQVYPGPQAAVPRTGYPTPGPVAAHQGYKAPTIDVFHLDDRVNAGISPEIRKRFQTDAQGRILFFTTPPGDVDNTSAVTGIHGGKIHGHSARYLATKAEREKKIREKRKSEGVDGPPGASNKRHCAISEETADEPSAAKLQELLTTALDAWSQQILDGMIADMKQQHGDAGWRAGLQAELDRVSALQENRLKQVEYPEPT